MYGISAVEKRHVYCKILNHLLQKNKRRLEVVNDRQTKIAPSCCQTILFATVRGPRLKIVEQPNPTEFFGMKNVSLNGGEKLKKEKRGLKMMIVFSACFSWMNRLNWWFIVVVQKRWKGVGKCFFL